MRRLNMLSCLVVLGLGALGCGALGCGSANPEDGGVDAQGHDGSNPGDANVPQDAPTDSSPPLDANDDASPGTFECEEAATFVATDEPVTKLEWAGAYLLLGTPSALESRRIDLSLVDREDSATVSLSADAGRVAVFDGSDARLFAIDDDGRLTASGTIDVSGRSVLALRESRLFTFRYPLAARINTVEAVNIEDLATPLPLGEVQVEGTGPTDVQIDGDQAYALDSIESRLSVVDISNPGSMNVTNTLNIPDIALSSELVVTPAGIFVGSASALVHVDVGGTSVLGTSAGGALVARNGARLATASASQVFIYRLSDDGAEIVATHDTVSPPTALLWSEDVLLVGSADGVRSRPCAIR